VLEASVDGGWGRDAGWVVAHVDSALISKVYGFAPNDVWFVTTDGFLHYNGRRFQKIACRTTNGIVSLWGASSADLWAVGPGSLLHSRGQSFSNDAINLVPPEHRSISSVSGSAIDQFTQRRTILFSTLSGAVLSFDSLTDTVSMWGAGYAGKELNWVYAKSGPDYLVGTVDAGVWNYYGENGNLRSEGTGYMSELEVGTPAFFMAYPPMWGLSPLEAPRMMDFTVTPLGPRWVAVAFDGTAFPHAISSSSASNVWAIASGGAVYRVNGNGTSFDKVTVIDAGSAGLTDVWTSGADDVWVTSGTSILHGP
jgi:hypothetical protein